MAHLNWKRWLLASMIMAMSAASQAITIDLAEALGEASTGNTATITSGETNLCTTPSCAGTKNPERITGWSAIFAGTFSDGSGLELIGLTEGTPANGGIISDIIRVQWQAIAVDGILSITIDFFSDADNGTIFGSPVGTCSPTGAAPGSIGGTFTRCQAETGNMDVLAFANNPFTAPFTVRAQSDIEAVPAPATLALLGLGLAGLGFSRRRAS